MLNCPTCKKGLHSTGELLIAKDGSLTCNDCDSRWSKLSSDERMFVKRGCKAPFYDDSGFPVFVIPRYFGFMNGVDLCLPTEVSK